MPIPIRCSGCSRTINAPDHAAGKRVKCPACGTVLSVPAAKPAAASPAATTPPSRSPAAPTPAANPPAATPPAAAFPSSPAFSPFGPSKEVDDSVLTDGDFQSYNPAAPRAKSGTEIPKTKKKFKRPKSYYWLPGVCGIVAASLNLLVAIGLIVWVIVIIVLIANAGEGGIAAIIGIALAKLIIFSIWGLGGSFQAIVACMNLIAMRSRASAQVAVGAFFFNPFAYALVIFLNGGGPILLVVILVLFGLWNWPCAVWISLVVSGEQAKIDFDEMDNDDLEEAAAELQRRAAMKEGGGH